MKKINVIKSKNGLSLTLQGVIADHSGFVLFYDAIAQYDMSTLNLNDVQFFQGDDELPGPSTWSTSQ